MQRAIFRGSLTTLVVGLCELAAGNARAGVPGFDLADLVAKVSPAVVNIQTTRLLKTSRLAEFVEPAANGGPRTPQRPAPHGQVVSSLGTGFVVAAEPPSRADLEAFAAGASPSGKLKPAVILTNEHVVQDAAEIEILLAGRSEHFLAKVLARDPRTDIAVLLARLPATIEPLALGDSSRMRVGETVFAIGNPFGLGHTVTAGILSAKDRILGTGRADRYLQTDAAINFGNSGGPLFNAKAEVVGINTLIRADAQGIGFAIPSNTVKKWLPALAAKGDLARAWLGLVVANLSTALRNLYGVADEAATGVIVTHLVKGSPAQKLGLEEGDRLTSLRARGQAVALDNVWALRDAIDALSPGDEVEMEIYRRAKRLSGKVKLGRMPTEDRLPEGHDYY